MLTTNELCPPPINVKVSGPKLAIPVLESLTKEYAGSASAPPLDLTIPPTSIRTVPDEMLVT